MKKKIIISNLKPILIKFLFLITLLYILLFRIFGITRIDNNSMSPNISYGSLLFFYRLDNNYEIGDVITFKKDDKKYYLRVIAKEGETVSINLDGEFINSNFEEVNKNYYHNIIPDYSTIKYPYMVPDNEVFAVSDNRNNIDDSRVFGSINKDIIEGKVIGFLKTEDM